MVEAGWINHIKKGVICQEKTDDDYEKVHGVRSTRAVAQKPNSKISDNLSFDK
jgi:hypothetical protein